MNRSIAAWALLTFFAASLSALMSVTEGREVSQNAAPDGWKRESRYQPFVSTDVVGRSVPAFQWSLGAYQTLRTEMPADQMGISVVLPPQSELFVSLGMEQPRAGAGLLLKPDSIPVAQRITPSGKTESLSCTGSLPAGTSGEDDALQLSRTTDGFSATRGDATMQCSARVGPAGPAIISGLRRARVQTLTVDGGHLPPQIPWWPSVAAFLLVMGLGYAERRVGVSTRNSLLSWLPLGACLPLISVSSDLVSEAIRVPEDTHGLLVLYSIIGLTGTSKLILLMALLSKQSLSNALQRTGLGLIGVVVLILLARTQVGLAIGIAIAAPLVAAIAHRWLVRSGEVTPIGGTLAIALGAPAGAALAMALQVSAPIACLYGVMGGVCLGTLVWVQVQARQMRAYNTSALVLTLAIVGCTEVVARFSPVGPLWNAVDTQRGAGSMETLIQQFEDLDAANYRAYPSDGFAVKPPPRSAPVRIACLGASSTGGAWQNDDLDDFFPAELNTLLGPSVQVINQGVGGWTSFHIRMFLDRHLDTIDPDVITIYLGVNERLSTPVPFAELHQRWKAGDLKPGWTVLNRVRLFQGLRLAARAMRPGAGAGVSPDELADNLRGIITQVRARGIRTLLMSEGVQPDPGILWAYFDAMDRVARDADDVAYLDTASVLRSTGTHAFIDTNHLTLAGHKAVGQATADRLETLGWLTPRKTAD